VRPAPVTHPDESDARRRPLIVSLARLARPHQWAKSAFVLLGPLYGLRDLAIRPADALLAGLLAAGVFALASSACYVVNDLLDAEQDRVHPRKRHRPIARGDVSRPQALVFAAMLVLAAAALVFALPAPVRPAVGLFAGLHVLNVWAYSLRLKHVVVADVTSLSLGFVLRVFGGCAAVGIGPSTWLLNCTLFLAMFLAFGKRLGERRTMTAAGADAATARGVQAAYTDDLLRMFVVVSAVGTLITYAGYVQSRDADFTLSLFAGGHGRFNVLWLSVIPATYALLRSIVLVERGRYDDPTELALKDPPTQIAAAAFGVVSIAAATHALW